MKPETAQVMTRIDNRASSVARAGKPDSGVARRARGGGRASSGLGAVAVGALAFGIALSFGADAARADAVAIDEPEIDPDLADGSVAIRVIGEDASYPMAGESVMIAAEDDSSLTARTGSSGWARFPELEPGTTYAARVETEEALLESSPFEVPEEGGVRVTLSTEVGADPGPTQHQPAGEQLAGGGGPPEAPAAAAGGGQRPDPREMSGMPRPERDDPPGRLTVRAIQGDFSPTESRAPDGARIHLVGYGAEGELSYESQAVPEDEDRVAFDGLRTDRSVAYYVLAVFEREDAVDRLMSQPITMPSTTGVRVMLAGPEADSDEEPVDGVAEQTGVDGPPLPPGKVVGRLVGDRVEARHMELVDVTEESLAEHLVEESDSPPPSPERAAVGRPEPIPADMQGDFTSPSADDGLEDGAVRVHVTGQNRDLDGIAVKLAPEGEGEAIEGKTGADGYASFTGALPGERYRALAEVHDREFESPAFSIPEEGGKELRLPTSWQAQGMLEARFDGVEAGADRVYAAQVETSEGVYRSMPFQLTEERGASVGVVVFDETLLRFHLGGEIDDELFWFDAQFGVRNPSTAPMMPEGGQVAIPLPDGFRSASVSEEDEDRVRTDSEGFLLQGPIPPGQQQFRGQFAIPTSGGSFEFDMPLPHGAMNSQVILEKWDGMTLRLPDVRGMQEDTRELGGREFTLLSGINIQPERRLVIGGEGLPERSPLMRYLKWVAGVLGVGLLVWGFVGLFRTRGGAEEGDHRAALESQRQRLLDELAELERQYRRGDVGETRYSRSKENLRIELENLYAELGVGGGEGERKAS